MTNEPTFSAILLLGPTGSGKTPLGQMFERRGSGGRRCLHFDFGDNLREAVRRDEPDEIISRQDLDFLHNVLERGALLEDDDFPIAGRLLRDFLSRHRADRETILVMNGLPRHIGQASALQSLIAIETVVCLECPPETVLRRICNDAGGDRMGRKDDHLSAVLHKLNVYHARTAPLIDWYRQRGARILPVHVFEQMNAAELWAAVQADLGGCVDR